MMRFEAERGRLLGLAYRMLGSYGDAEDAVQDAWLRWQGVAEMPRNISAYLSMIVTRLCLDRLKQAQRHREVYVGPWLPEPILEDPVFTEPGAAVARDVSFALMLALERLSPLERAAFVLHDVFDVPFAEVAVALGRSEASCRQLASRAREHVRAGRPRFTVQPDEADAIADAFFAASKSGDTEMLASLLVETASLHTDGGGKKRAARNVIQGADRIARFYTGLAGKPHFAPPVWRRRLVLDGLPACLTVEADGTREATLLDLRAGRVAAVYVVRNPDKLERLWQAMGSCS
ncbi:RNA polymerase sigma factor SigJ [Telmatospirillum sp. J64-1]|uniref:RNA polymerase sigma factor SigJ n=1 Tax=Telmatospirillum sp. J64-1 TaxID=2502183 RepID=UPI001C8F41AD|nr:RNA polymerase sigma factor SigJ [Telmatospirillum sp. J64-1]